MMKEMTTTLPCTKDVRKALNPNVLRQSTNISNCHVTIENLQKLIEHENFNNVETLILENNGLRPPALSVLATALRDGGTPIMPKLTFLSVANNELFDDSRIGGHLEKFCTELKLNTTLTHLDIGQNKVRDVEVWPVLTRGVLPHTSLRSLGMSHEGPLDVGKTSVYFGEMTSIDLTLINLDISYVRVSASNFVIGLESLILKGCPMETAAFETLCTNLQTSETLTHLDVSMIDNILTQTGTFRDALSTNKTIRHLKLKSNSLTQYHIVTLFGTLNSQLETLDLEDTSFVNVDQLKQYLDRTPSLTSLKLFSNNLTKDAASSLMHSDTLKHLDLRRANLMTGSDKQALQNLRTTIQRSKEISILLDEVTAP